MAIVNRDCSASEQHKTYVADITGSASSISAGIMNPVVGTGLTFPVALITSQSKLISGGEASWGASGSPVHSLWIYRFAGGFTSIQVGGDLAVTSYGTSGYLAFSMMAASVSYPLQVGDELVLYATGSNSATAKTRVSLVVQCLQDIVTDFGV